jgi:hypothetical protein
MPHQHAHGTSIRPQRTLTRGVMLRRPRCILRGRTDPHQRRLLSRPRRSSPAGGLQSDRAEGICSTGLDHAFTQCNSNVDDACTVPYQLHHEPQRARGPLFSTLPQVMTLQTTKSTFAMNALRISLVSARCLAKLG